MRELQKTAVTIKLANGDTHVFELHKYGVTGIYSRTQGVTIYTSITELVFPWANVVSVAFTREVVGEGTSE
jgi:hypothetical protein